MGIDRIAITQRVIENDSYPERRDALAHDWSQFFAGLYPAAALLPVPNHPESVSIWLAKARPDVIVFSNGNDWGASRERDLTERSLFEAGRSRGIPMLGVCRGMQVLNVFCGGSIEADVSSFAREKHVAIAHDVEIVDGCFGDMLGHRIHVNSYHQQGVLDRDCSPQLKVFARSPAGVIEGLYHPELPILAIQWHPERECRQEVDDRAMICRLFEEGAFWRGSA